MPLVAYYDLPTFQRLKEEGRTILPAERALKQEIRQLHVGLLNIMPDAALQATERQFFRLVGESNQIAQFYMHPFTLSEIPRSPETQNYIDRYYEPAEKIMADGLDALIISGANISDPDLTRADFWEPLQKIIGWSWDNVTSTLCSCLATHAVMQFKYGLKRKHLKQKRWGVYRHHITQRQHPIVRGVNTVFDVPHSRHNDIRHEQFESAGFHVLASSEEGGAHVAVSPDGLRMLCFQGHPEYDTISLYKEYKREYFRYASGEITTKPLFPQNYFCRETRAILSSIKNTQDWPISDIDMEELLENSWGDSARSMIGNWIGLVYQLTNIDRKKPFMENVDPENPLASI